MKLVERAIEFAAHAHRKQVRKGTKIPYISHPFAVGMMLQRAGCPEEVVAAGILHDTLEDTSATSDQLLKKFGPVVLEIVQGCSEPDKEASWEERKQHTLDFLKSASLEIRLVACADKLHNIRTVKRDLARHGEATWERFKRGRERQLWYYTGLVESLGYASRFPLLEELQETVADVFGLRPDEPHWQPLRKNKKFMAAAFETAVGEPGVLEAKLPYFKRIKADELMTKVHALATPLDPAFQQSYDELDRYLSVRGMAFPEEEGKRAVRIAAVLRSILYAYPSEVYHQFDRFAEAE